METVILNNAKQHNLILTSSSDFHDGLVKPKVKLGMHHGEKIIDEHDLKYFSKFINNDKL